VGAHGRLAKPIELEIVQSDDSRASRSDPGLHRPRLIAVDPRIGELHRHDRAAQIQRPVSAALSKSEPAEGGLIPSRERDADIQVSQVILVGRPVLLCRAPHDDRIGGEDLPEGGSNQQRLADRAEAGQTLVTERTMLEVEDIVDGKLVDEVSLKSIHRPMRIYEVLSRVE
jgi:hypothetical protein